MIEVAFFHLKKTVRGTGRVLRGRSGALVRQESWALLLAHNMIASLAARAASAAGLSPGHITFTAVLSLARTPAAAAANQIGWDDVQVEDCYTGPNGTIGGTTLGPRWPELRLGGAIYLERDFARALPAALRPPCPPIGMSAHRYECMTTVYRPHLDDPRGGNRYAGHHAEILREQGTLAQVAVYPPGRSQAPGVRPSTMWIDLASSEQCDAGPGSLTTIGAGNAPKRGALFLISGHLADDL